MAQEKSKKKSKGKSKIEYRGETFSGYNKPKKTGGDSKKKMVVLAKEGDKVKMVRFGAKGYEDYADHKDKKRRANFRSRHKCDQKKSKLTAGYWACNYKGKGYDW